MLLSCFEELYVYSATPIPYCTKKIVLYYIKYFIVLESSTVTALLYLYVYQNQSFPASWWKNRTNALI